MPPSIRPLLRQSTHSSKRHLSDSAPAPAPPNLRIPPTRSQTTKHSTSTLLESLRSATQQRIARSSLSKTNKDLSTSDIVAQGYRDGRVRSSFGTLSDSSALDNVSSALRNSGRFRTGGRSESMGRQTDVKQRLGRSFKEGDVYAPRDLGPGEHKNWLRKTITMKPDPFELMGRDPLEFYKNFSVLSEYLSRTNTIKPRSQTNLTPKNQKRMAKAIRRAIGIGLIPSTHAHPHLISAKIGLHQQIGSR